MAEASLTTCGACGGALRKVFHPAGIMFKGSGFYSTDSRSKSKTSNESPAEGGGKSDKPKADTKTETTPSKPSSETKMTPSKEKSA